MYCGHMKPVWVIANGVAGIVRGLAKAEHLLIGMKRAKMCTCDHLDVDANDKYLSGRFRTILLMTYTTASEKAIQIAHRIIAPEKGMV
jgi:hypothetical protein